jgi:hypothetical protein
MSESSEDSESDDEAVVASEESASLASSSESSMRRVDRFPREIFEATASKFSGVDDTGGLSGTFIFDKRAICRPHAP